MFLQINKGTCLLFTSFCNIKTHKAFKSMNVCVQPQLHQQGLKEYKSSDSKVEAHQS
ncbi:hypothetical protein DsansV1_C01g0011591 [Dioscorea sansibarensis]